MPIDVDEALLLSAASTVGTSKTVIINAQYNQIIAYVQWSPGVSGGSVTLDTAAEASYSGQWAEITKLTGEPNRVDIVQLSGAYGALRTLISSTIVGGNVTTWILAN